MSTQWKLIRDPRTSVEYAVWRELENGNQECRLLIDPEYLEWLEEGNTPLPADEPNERTE